MPEVSAITHYYVARVRMRRPDKRMVLWAVTLVVAFGIGFALGAALWEGEDVVPPGWSSEPAGFVTKR